MSYLDWTYVALYGRDSYYNNVIATPMCSTSPVEGASSGLWHYLLVLRDKCKLLAALCLILYSRRMMPIDDVNDHSQAMSYTNIKTAEQRTIIQQCGDWYTGRWWVVGCYCVIVCARRTYWQTAGLAAHAYRALALRFHHRVAQGVS